MGDSSTAGGATFAQRCLNHNTINPNVVRIQYAVRGELAIRAEQLRKQLHERPGSLPYDKIVACNIGNPQELGQKPIKYLRQVLSLLEYPEPLPAAMLDAVPTDVRKRVQRIKESMSSMGAYSQSKGLLEVRRSIAAFIERRDKFCSDPENIFCTNGASDAVHRVLTCIISSPTVGVMIPIPQYPLYSAAITLLNGTIVPYYLDEGCDWSLSIAELERAWEKAANEGIQTRALCLINPGNPTGNCLPESVLAEVIHFCRSKRLVLLADEVYQVNVYGANQFTSARRVAKQLEAHEGPVELFSFHSISKGIVGECGHRAGYVECLNIDPFVMEQLYKLFAVHLCPNLPGQVLMQLMVEPPVEGDESYELYKKETDAIYQSLAKRAKILANGLCQMEGVSCNQAGGAMYLFPQFRFPLSFVEKAKSLGKLPDELYCLLLIEATGICVIPGSGFGQAPGTFHVRTTFLPPEEEMDNFIRLWQDFHSHLFSTASISI